MTNDKRRGHLPVLGTQAKNRHDKYQRAQLHDARVWRQLNPLKEPPPKLKHKSYYEAVENLDKKKKLEVEVTNKKPLGAFEFVPIGNPELTTLCKELSREQGCLIYIISDSKDTNSLDHHMHRSGYSFRQNIVDQARRILREKGVREDTTHQATTNLPESQSQGEIHRQADAVLRDLFPRIPNTDRIQIIKHAFEKDGKFNGKAKVGVATNIPLARRVQLAALAHIRHTHTRYDQLWPQSGWANARKAVEQPCLDVIVKWRGDEETGRDQLDEILREVIEISDTEDGSDDESSTGEAAPAAQRTQAPPRNNLTGQQVARAGQPSTVQGHRRIASASGPSMAGHGRNATRKEKRLLRKTQQRFRRYAAAAEAITNGSNVQGPQSDTAAVPFGAPAMDRTASENSNHYPGPEHGTYLRMAQLPLSTQRYDHRRGHYADEMPGTIPQERDRNMPRGPKRPDIPMRGQSPLLVRVGDGNVPKVGPPLDRHRYVQSPPSPVRHGLQDMLLPSIEPLSPSGFHNPQHPSQSHPRVPHPFADGSRVVSRTIIHEPIGSGVCHRSPGFVVISDENTRARRRVTTHYPDDFGTRSDLVGHNLTGHLSRDEDRRFTSSQYLIEPPEPPAGHPIGLSGSLATRKTPVVYIEDSPYRSRDEVAFGTRTNPIETEPPRQVNRIIEMRGVPAAVDHERMHARRVEVIRDPSTREVRRYSNGLRVVHVDDHRPRASHVLDYRGEPYGGLPHQSHAPREAEIFVRSHEPRFHAASAAGPGHQDRLYDDVRGVPNSGFCQIEMSGNVTRRPTPGHFDVHHRSMRDGLGPLPDSPHNRAEHQFHGQTLRADQLPPQQPYPAHGTADQAFLPYRHRMPPSNQGFLPHQQLPPYG